MARKDLIRLAIAVAFCSVAFGAQAQERLPEDRSWVKYHRNPDWRESEAHPLRIIAYVFHPIGWLAREVIFRPFSYFMSSSEKIATVSGYRDPRKFNMGSCFTDSSTPNCKTTTPFNYRLAEGESLPEGQDVNGMAQVFFPDVNFDFNKRELNDLGKGKVRQLAALLKMSPGMVLVLEGHTDAAGSDAYNEKLGTDRAEAVRRELVAQGVDASSLSTLTFGETQQALSEGDAPANAVNRRVAVKAQKAAAAK